MKINDSIHCKVYSFYACFKRAIIAAESIDLGAQTAADVPALSKIFAVTGCHQ